MSYRPISAVYFIKNIENGKMYIGQSKSVCQRWAEHRSTLKRGVNGNKYLQSEYDLYGCDAFVYGILEECDQEILYEKEKEYVELFGTTNRDAGYNIKNGGLHEGVYGSDNGMYSRKHRDESKLLMSKRAKERQAPWLGKHLPDYMKRNIGKHNSEVPNSRSKTILCVTTGEVFDMFSKAKRKYGIKGNISVEEICLKRKTYGKLSDGTPLEWKLVANGA